MPFDFSPLWISLRTAGLATGITFCLGIAIAYWMLGYRGRWKSVLEGIFISPLVLPPTVVGFLLLLLFGKNGMLGQLLQRFDFSIVFTGYAAVLTATVVSFPLMYKTALGAFEQIDRRLLQVAETLGASQGRIFWQIILPLSVPGILAGVTLSFARALGEFGATLMLAGNIPGQTQTMPMAIYFAVEAGAMSEAWLWVGTILLISLSMIAAVNLWQQQFERRGDRLPDRPSAIEGIEPVDRASGFGDIPDLPPSPNLLSRSESSVLGLTPGLTVDIQKDLPSFRLNVALSARQETLGILGGSGAGKSLLLRCIAGVETPTQGKITLNGRSLFDSEQQINLPSHRRNIGLVFQNYALFPHLTIAQNVEFGLQKLSKAERSRRVAQQLALVQLHELGERYPHQLSGGQQQRVALARALATEPEALLLDEPFSALDTYLRSQLERQLIQRLSSYPGVTLFVTHNLEEAYRACENLIVLSGGNAIASGAKHHIFEHPPTVRVAQLTGCKNFSRAVVSADFQEIQRVEAIDWGITVQVAEAIPAALSNIGIRAHQIRIAPIFNPASAQANTFPGWLAATSETPHRMTLYLKFNAAPTHAQDYQVQAEVFKDSWTAIKDQPLPWAIQLDPLHLILMKG
jgi:molybdate ABC transporter permease protein